ncbi:glycoside hydrolase family 3 C-terminal domain-containing protein [Carboxylicivirga mesophila]|uniref:Glycoside hydrolase family 3 C-terminal domain-containing protein n=1 Tax=Carboxylicivirga mesophila TaxID=1166478 RepID=A0ABS5K5Q1_9BACT|nr:glycoside hydrolase family 3 N-terminal domain-containing protein [Carboxylicivirga mesophila]MBS2210277.1 glycoside hydrolase family 3 C-terminal domain-containing protein [Carboxylicivirga mesophila]
MNTARSILIGLSLLVLVVGCNQSGRQYHSKNDKISQRVDSLLSLMTIDEKIGQTVLFTSRWDVTGPVLREGEEEAIKEGRCGNIFNAHTVAYTHKLQEMAVNETRLGIPLLFGYDVIHGHQTLTPISLGESASWDLELIEQSARMAAREAAASGLHWTFAPMCDIGRDPRWGRVSEGAGEDPYLGQRIAEAKVKGFQGDDISSNETVLACVKHMAAYGAAQAGRDYHSVDMSDRVLRETYLPPYKAAVDAGARTVMTSFNDLDGVPASANKYLLTDILRDEWGFDGMVVTDYTAINELIPHGVAADEYHAGVLAMKAGVDMDMEGGVYMEYLKQAIEKGDVSEAELDNAVRNVLRLKFELGIMDDPYKYCNEEFEQAEVLSDRNRQLAYEMAAASCVLLKNEQAALPLKPSDKIAVIGPLANSKRDLLGSWKAAGKPQAIESTILDAIIANGGKGNVSFTKGCDVNSDNRSGFAKAIQQAKNADKVVMVMGEKWSMSGEAACRTNLDFPGVQAELIEQIAGLGKPVVLVYMTGRSMTIEKEVKLADAVMNIWYPGTEGGRAVADLLYGKQVPSGKLTMTMPRNVGQIPIYYNYKNTGRPFNPEKPKDTYKSRYLDVPNTPLFPFGYGLSYTTFKYSNLKLDKSSMRAGDDITLSVEVSNTGDFDGAEVVQLYIRDKVASVTRPMKELKAFEKVFIKKGETKTITFTITEDMLAFYRQDMSFGTEPGDFTVYVGTNSDTDNQIDFTLE